MPRKNIPYPYGGSYCLIDDRITALEMKLGLRNNPITVSPIGLKDGCKLANNGCMFGPDTGGTKTSGINEAIAKAESDIADALEGNISISTSATGNTVLLMQGIFFIKQTIKLSQGIRLCGAGRLATLIRLAPEDFDTSMDSLIKVPANANDSSIIDMTIIGRRETAYQSYSIDGIRLEGYTWRVTLANLEIVDCQGNGIGMYSSDNADNSINFEPIIFNVSIISCMYGMTLTYCADEALMAVNIENCDEGLRYYGGNGKWFDVHIFDCPLGCRISGAPLRSVDMTLDTNMKPMIIENIDDSISPGLIQLISPIFVDNNNAMEIKSDNVRLINPNFIVKKISTEAWINSANNYEVDYPLNETMLTGTKPNYLCRSQRVQHFTSTYNTAVSIRSQFRIQVLVDGIIAADDSFIKTGSSNYYIFLKKYFNFSSTEIYRLQIYFDSNETVLGMNLYDSSDREVSGKTIEIYIYD